jgi:hypothetical protein
MADTNTGLTILQNDIFSKILLPFLLVFFVVFAVLEKTKILGDKKQIHALVAFVIGLIFVGAVYPVLVVSNLILFLTVAIVAVFVVLLIWGFIFGDIKDSKLPKYLMIGLGIIATIAFIVAVVWATGWWTNIQELLNGNNGLGSTIITNAIFLIVIGVALALVMVGSNKK